MQPPTPLHGLRRVTWRAGISISCAAGQRASAIRLSLPRQASASSIAASLRASVVSASARSAQRRRNGRLGVSLFSIGVASAAATAANQRPASKPTGRSTRELARVLKASSAASKPAICAAICSAGGVGGVRTRPTSANHPRQGEAPRHSRWHAGNAASTSLAPGRGAVISDRCSTAGSKVFSAVTRRTLM